jgi:hypothetical protein
VPRFTDTLPSLDVRVLTCAGLLAPGASCSLAWTDGATVTATVNDAGDVLTLAAGDSGEAVPIDAQPNTKGGDRLWFTCSGCGRRCAVLFVHGGRWRCRLCLNLTYRSVYTDPAARAVKRCQMIRAKLGAMDRDWQTVPARPRSMHTSTYRRLADALAGWQQKARALCLDSLDQMTA